ncbi:MAG: response regulator [Daejeonella sp.]|uniref:response regulator n=1 Tax=Daejeonella sp. JGW-45 TaxID=3034148 RepID=UPI0023EBC7C2|nr:response regulator [Daejeonella sp. JGW-45]
MGKKILIMDDDKDVLEMLKEVLTYENFEVDTVSDLALFLQYFEEGCQPDLVIIDYLLRGINGGEVCYQLKVNEQTCRIPVILMSAYPQVFNSLGDYKCDEFIAKPFDLYDLVETIHSRIRVAESAANPHRLRKSKGARRFTAFRA